MKISYLFLLALLLIGILVASCSSSTSTTSPPVAPTATTSIPPVSPTSSAEQPATTTTPQYGGTFRIIDPRSPSGDIGWFAEPGPPPGMWLYPMFEFFFQIDHSGVIHPMLATDWQISPDLTSITIKLRSGVKFHDGSDFNGTVAKWNIDQFIAAKLPAVKNVSSVDLIDDYTIKVNLKHYQNTQMNDLASIPIVSKAAYDKNGLDWVRKNPVGTGPFKFASYTPDTVMKFTRFDNYWQKSKPYLDAVEVSFIVDPLTAEASFEAGEADAVGGDNPTILSDLQKKNYPILKTYTGAITLIPDSKNPDSPLANLKVRQAIDYAINRDAIVQARGFGLWTTTYQFASPDSSAYIQNLSNRSYNPDKAKQLLADAGYPNGFKITLIGDSSTTDKDATVAVQGFLSKVGIDAELDWVDFAGFVQFVMGGWKNGLLACANGFSANMNGAIDMVWAQDAVFFPSVLKSDELQSLIQTSLDSKDYDPALVQKVNQYMYDDAMFLPLYCITRGDALKSNVHGTGLYSLDSWPAWLPADTWLSK